MTLEDDMEEIGDLEELLQKEKENKELTQIPTHFYKTTQKYLAQLRNDKYPNYWKIQNTCDQITDVRTKKIVSKVVPSQHLTALTFKNFITSETNLFHTLTLFMADYYKNGRFEIKEPNVPEKPAPF